jgi:F420-dependent oxidoreductase-like protein
MRFGIDVAQQRAEFAEIVERVRLGEDLGFDGAWGFDHFVPMYGEGPGNCFEGMTTLAALAAATSRIRLGLLVTGVTYRHPSVLAAQAVTVDHASGGRLELALGAAWFEAEHRQLGIEFPSTGTRFDRLEDELEILTRLFSGEVVSYHGKQLSLDGAQMRPVPVQQPHPPIWIGGSGRRRTLPLAARWADVWHTYGSPAQMRELSGELDRLADAAGRDPSAIVRASSLSLSEPMDEVRRAIGAMKDVGVDYLVCGWPGEGSARVEEFATTVMPAFTDT